MKEYSERDSKEDGEKMINSIIASNCIVYSVVSLHCLPSRKPLNVKNLERERERRVGADEEENPPRKGFNIGCEKINLPFLH